MLYLTVSVDASESGNGKLEILINEGKVPCEVQNSGSRKFLATFVPETAQPHSVRVLFNDVEVTGRLATPLSRIFLLCMHYQ